MRGEFTTYGTTPPYTYVHVRVPLYTRTRIRIHTLNEKVNNTAQIHNDGQLETANVRPQNRLVSTHFESFQTNYIIYPSKCWRYMHHIKSDILTSHLSPTLTELRWRVLRYVWPNPGMSQRVQWFFSLPSVAWDDFAPAWPAHSMRETVRDVAAHVESR